MDHLAVHGAPPAFARGGWRSTPQLDVDPQAPQQGVLFGRRGKLLLWWQCLHPRPGAVSLGWEGEHRTRGPPRPGSWGQNGCGAPVPRVPPESSRLRSRQPRYWPARPGRGRCCGAARAGGLTGRSSGWPTAVLRCWNGLPKSRRCAVGVSSRGCVLTRPSLIPRPRVPRGPRAGPGSQARAGRRGRPGWRMRGPHGPHGALRRGRARRAA